MMDSPFIIPEPGPDHPANWYRRCLEYPEHVHLKDGEPHMAFLLRTDPLFESDRRILGAVHLPRVQGKLNRVFLWMVERMFGAMPDFLVVLDGEYWTAADDRHREILIFHELSHCVHATDGDGEPRYDDETGRPIWKLTGHSVEEFTSVVRRYGAWNDELREFVGAAGVRVDRGQGR
ncbi:hypothetical protein SAMN02949497_1243 [Methylomagnum ishizawai]|uniref:Putative phage metallopeptidase domain-containing protein n=1 Tax=Methylomagnum ishizawai TaxID=1760988 RepID=A0A1Y6CUG5_9GAMM|nr:putative metallopeptidase [Methylomagnum ishizawai]SMF93947.1 hypothetical protein SAMN02949497_1243 [Methylomagnum ishizawai]